MKKILSAAFFRVVYCKTIFFGLIFLSLVPALGAAEVIQAHSIPAQIEVSNSLWRLKPWVSLNEKEKNLVYHLHLALSAARQIFHYQNHRYGHVIAKKFQTLLFDPNDPNFSRGSLSKLSDDARLELLRYSQVFELYSGPYGVDGVKYVLKKISPNQILDIFSDQPESLRAEIALLLTDPRQEILSHLQFDSEVYFGKNKSLVGGNLFAKNITDDDLQLAARAGFRPELNCYVYKDVSQQIRCQPYGLDLMSNDQGFVFPQIVRHGLEVLVAELRAAASFAQNAYQRQEFEQLAAFFQTGDKIYYQHAYRLWDQDRVFGSAGQGQIKIDFFLFFYPEPWTGVMPSQYDQQGPGRLGGWIGFIDEKESKRLVDVHRFAATERKSFLAMSYFETLGDQVFRAPFLIGDQKGLLILPQSVDFSIRHEQISTLVPRLSGLSLKELEELFPQFEHWKRMMQDVFAYLLRSAPLGSNESVMWRSIDLLARRLLALNTITNPQWVEAKFFRSTESAQNFSRWYSDFFLAESVTDLYATDAKMVSSRILMIFLFEKNLILNNADDSRLEIVDQELFLDQMKKLYQELIVLLETRDENALKLLIDRYSSFSERDAIWVKKTEEKVHSLRMSRLQSPSPWKINRDLVLE